MIPKQFSCIFMFILLIIIVSYFLITTFFSMKNVYTVLLLLCVFVAQSQSITDSLKAHFTCNQTLQDATIYNHDLGLNYGNLNYTTKTNGDSVLSLDGNTQISSINTFDITNYSEICVSLWFKTSVITSDIQIMLQGAYVGFGIYVAPNSGKVMGFFDGSSTNALESSTSLTDNEWHHVLIQYDGTTTYMYIDGVLDGTLQEPFYQGNGTLFIGKSSWDIMPYTGELNEIRIYNRTLSENEIKELYTTYNVNSTNQINLEDLLILYPNPTNYLLNIKPEDNYDYIIFDTKGAKMLEGNGTEVDVSILEAGTYYIRINNLVTKSFIKK